MIEAHPEGAVVTVWVVPGASRDEITGTMGDAVKVRVSAAAEGGKANRRLVRLVRDRTGARRVDVLSGASSRHKRLLLTGCEPAEVARALGVEWSCD